LSWFFVHLGYSRIVGFSGFFSLDLLSLKFLVSFIVKRGSLLLLCNPCIYLVTASKSVFGLVFREFF